MAPDFILAKKIILSTASVMSVMSAALVWPRPIVLLLKNCFPRILWEVESDKSAIALTFDDGPDPLYTPQVLVILRDFHVPATFFLVGERSRKYPELVAEIRKSGHEIGNHSDSWRRTLALKPSEFERDLLQAELSLGLAGATRKLFRPAGIWITSAQEAIARKHGYTCVLGSSYAFDPYRPPAGVLSFLIKRSLKGGGIVVLHDSGGNRERTVRALPNIIHSAMRNGLRFRTVSGLLGGRPGERQ